MSAKHVSARRLLAGAVLAGTAAGPFTAVLAADEIIVTARRIEENIQEVPVSVSAFSLEQLQQLNVTTIDEVARFTPGFSFNSAFGRQSGSDRPAIRGITTIVNGIGNASAAAYFIDGIYLGGSPQSTELANLERIEVIKGPQAAQFGRGTYAGAISYVTRRPSMDGVEGQVRVTGAEFGTFEASAWVSAPIVQDKLAFFLAGGYNESDGAFDNQRTGGKLGGTEDQNVTAKLLFTPVEGLEITLKGGRQTTDDGHFPIYLQGRGLNNCFFRNANAPRAREYYCGTAKPNWNDMRIATDVFEAVGVEPGARLDRNLGTLSIVYTDPGTDIQFSSLTGYVEDRLRTAFDVSYSGHNPLPVPASQNGAFFQFDRDDGKVLTQEFRVTTSQKARLRGTAGVYLFHQDAEEITNKRVIPTSTTPANAANPNNALQPQGPFTFGLQAGAVNLTDNRIRNIAIFGGVEYDFTDRLTAGIEARYAQDDIKQQNVWNDGSGVSEACIGPPANPGNPNPRPQPFCSEPLQATFAAVTPRISARYRVTDDFNVYGSISAGTKPGTFNPTVPDESFRNVDEERLIAYEIGAKSQWLDRRLTANVALFFNDVKDQQLTQNIEVNNQPQSLILNVGETQAWGVELETSFDITDNWNAGLNYAYVNSEIKKRISVDEADLRGWNGQQSTLAQFGDVAGNKSPRIPENMFALFSRYDIPFSWGGIYVGADVTYEGSRYSQEHNLIETGDRTVVGARLGIRYENWDLSVWGRNLTDDDTPVDILRYIDRRSGTLTSCASLITPPGTCGGPVAASSSPRGFALTPQQPRQFGATLNYRFGGQK
jgi:outer membrane receptor protein involved in Fe transport